MFEFRRRMALLPALAGAALAALTIAAPGTAGATSHPGTPQSGHRAPPATARVAPGPATGWNVTLTADPGALYTGDTSTLTATANSDVGPTPYYLRLYDETTHRYLNTCPFGTTCTASVLWDGRTVVYYHTFGRPTLPFLGVVYHKIEALISDNSTAYPPGDIQATTVTRVAMVTDIVVNSCPRPPRACI